jgi:malonate-semialdehyde dehydrogenase (acetylating)/methylmalonate-semialdehyde dehydrogenase
MSTEIQHFIGGKFVPGRSGRTAPVFNPATGEQQGVVPLASAAEVDEAVALALAAFPKWSMTTPLRRARILNRFLRAGVSSGGTRASPSHRPSRVSI